MAIDTGRLKHLEIIQQVISRMAANSFLIKGWSITLLSAILAIAIKEDTNNLMAVAFLPWAMFWVLDSFFLRQERLYRKLWDKRRSEPQSSPTDFDMNTSCVASQVGSWCEVAQSPTLKIFHGGLFCLIAAIFVFTHYLK